MFRGRGDAGCLVISLVRAMGCGDGGAGSTPPSGLNDPPIEFMSPPDHVLLRLGPSRHSRLSPSHRANARLKNGARLWDWA